MKIKLEELKEQLAKLDDIGGPWVHNNYPWGWTVAGNTPFRRWKRQTHEGGVADPMIISWPAGIDASQQGSTRRQYTHVIDVLPKSGVGKILRRELRERSESE